MALARGDIVVFTDANATYPLLDDRDAGPVFRDPSVGLVTGYTRYVVSGSGDVAQVTNSYTSLERVNQSRGKPMGRACVGADGAILRDAPLSLPAPAATMTSTTLCCR